MSDVSWWRVDKAKSAIRVASGDLEVDDEGGVPDWNKGHGYGRLSDSPRRRPY